MTEQQASPGIYTDPRLAEIGAQVARIRAEIGDSRLGRYRTARADQEVARRTTEQAAVTWAVRVGALLHAIHDGNEAAARAEIAALPLGQVADLLTGGETLAKLCAERFRGPR
jgi:hypothetical protein